VGFRAVKKMISREAALEAIAIEVDQALRIGPVAQIKHRGVTNGLFGLGGLESHLLGLRNGEHYSLHDWGHYGDIQATSALSPELPRGFFIALKTDTPAENESRGKNRASIPLEAKTPNYDGDYLKIDWVYPHKEIQGLGIPRQYFFAVERAAKKAGYPSIHIDATNNGLSYWSRKEFGLKIPKAFHPTLIEGFKKFKANQKLFTEQASEASPYVNGLDETELPHDIDPNEPHTIPRIFMDVLGAIFIVKGEGHLHFYKKF
jgi:hypothetical protein